MKRNNINYALVGTFVMLAMALLIYALARLSGNTEKHDVYYSTFPNVAGIADGSPVTYDGYQVGHVQSIEPINNNGRILYRVELLFKQDWKVPVDSSASISSSGLLSGQLVNVQQGKSQDFLKPGQDIPAQVEPPLIATMGGLVNDLRSIARDDVRPALQKLNARVDSLGNMLEQKGGATMDQASGTLQRANGTLERANGTLARLNVSADNLGKLLNDENRQLFGNILKNGDRTMQSVNLAVDEFNRSETDIRDALQQTQVILSNLERASRNMNELTRQLRESPSSIFSSPAPTDPVEATK